MRLEVVRKLVDSGPFDSDEENAPEGESFLLNIESRHSEWVAKERLVEVVAGFS